MGQYGSKVGLGGEHQVVVQGANSLGSHSNLCSRLLAGDVEDAAVVRRSGGHFEEEGGFADTGFARQQDHCSCHEPAAEDSIKFAQPARRRDCLAQVDRGDGDGGGANGTGPQGGGAWCTHLRNAAPGLALTASADPAKAVPPAFSAAERGTVFGVVLGHGPTLRREPDIQTQPLQESLRDSLSDRRRLISR